MAPLSGVWKQNSPKDTDRYRAYQFSLVLPEMQTGNFSKC